MLYELLAADPPFDPFFLKSAQKKSGWGKKLPDFFSWRKKTSENFRIPLCFFLGGASLDIFACDFRVWYKCTVINPLMKPNMIPNTTTIYGAPRRVNYALGAAEF